MSLFAVFFSGKSRIDAQTGFGWPLSCERRKVSSEGALLERVDVRRHVEALVSYSKNYNHAYSIGGTS